MCIVAPVLFTVEYHDEQKEMEMKARWRPLVKQEVKQEVKEETQSSPSHDYKPTDQVIQDGRSRNQRHDSPEGEQATSYRYVVHMYRKNFYIFI